MAFIMHPVFIVKVCYIAQRTVLTVVKTLLKLISYFPLDIHFLIFFLD